MCVCVYVCVCVCVCVCVLDHLTTVMRCHVQMIIADMFITKPATVLSCAATESLDNNSFLRHAQETSHIARARVCVCVCAVSVYVCVCFCVCKDLLPNGSIKQKFNLFYKLTN